MHKSDQQLLQTMIDQLVAEKGEEQVALAGGDLLSSWRALVNQRPAGSASSAYREAEKAFLTAYRERHQLGLDSCQPTGEQGIYLYTGDLCHLQVDGVVNAANSQLLGCFLPNHACLDNALHTFAGIDLRQACQDLMLEQGHEEPAGRVKLTPGFELPAKWVLHTVGPNIPKGKAVSAIRQNLLRSCYLACLELARTKGMTSLAFPALSTGEFGYPKPEAAQLAVETVQTWLREQDYPFAVIFSAFDQENQRIYQDLLGGRTEDDSVADT